PLAWLSSVRSAPARDRTSFPTRRSSDLQGLGGHDLARRVADVLQLVGLDSRADGATKEFSGGMKRRLNIGIGLLHRPELLILDEDRKSTRLNSSHVKISYAVVCLKQKNL